MKDKDKNRDPDRARKRAVTDMRCAMKKLGLSETMLLVANFVHEQNCPNLARQLLKVRQRLQAEEQRT
jgi:hypothetical protein